MELWKLERQVSNLTSTSPITTSRVGFANADLTQPHSTPTITAEIALHVKWEKSLALAMLGVSQ
jgi:hypothetical protein